MKDGSEVMAKTRWPDAAVAMTAWVAVATMVYFAISSISKMELSPPQAPAKVEQPNQAPTEDENHGVHFRLVDP